MSNEVRRNMQVFVVAPRMIQARLEIYACIKLYQVNNLNSNKLKTSKATIIRAGYPEFLSK
jgi:hypothetical protein